MIELHDQHELHIEQEAQQISLETLKAAQKCPVASGVEYLEVLVVEDLSFNVGLEGSGSAKKQGSNQ
ncbi:hypothetical protein TNCV_1368111 [Trichonephila clavipes]|nr:hypothetical protein TNCV_1368111 [Trichonephila clavipes]